MSEGQTIQSNEDILVRLQQLEANARMVTDNALDVEKTPSTLQSIIRRITKIEDKEIDAIQKRVDERAARGEIANIDCSKGCWFCCTQMLR